MITPLELESCRICFLAVVCLNRRSFLCRSVAVDSINQVTVLQLTHKTEVLLQTSTASFLLVRKMFLQTIYNSSTSRQQHAI